VVVQGASLAEVQGKAVSQTPPPAKAREKSPAAPGLAPAPGVSAPTPRAGDDAVSPGDWTNLAPCDVVDAPPGKKAKRGITDLRAVHLIHAFYKNIVSTRVRVELYDQKVNRKKSETKFCGTGGVSGPARGTGGSGRGGDSGAMGGTVKGDMDVGSVKVGRGRGTSTQSASRSGGGEVSHVVLEGKPNMNHIRVRIRNSRTHRLHNWTSSHNAQSK
jgi:hypothetical protein